MLKLGAVPVSLMYLPNNTLNTPLLFAVCVTPPEVWVVLGLITKPALLPVAIMLALILTLFDAVNVSVVLADQLIDELMLTSPNPLVAPAALISVTLLVPKLFCKVVPVMSPPLSATVKSTGSTNHSPYLPLADWVVTVACGPMLTRAADVSMKPPSPPLGALASNLPSTWVVPEVMSPSNKIRPLRLAMVCACTVPLFFTKLPIKALALRAVINTRPPSAISMCLFSTNALMMPCSTSTVVKLVPLNTNVALLPEAMATVPWCATMMPSLRTSGASKATKPPSAACSVPWLTTLAWLPLPLKLLFPAMKSSLLMPRVVTNKPPTSTCDLAPKMTPLALLMNTCPGALMRPMIWLGSPPTTRLSVTDDADG